MSAFVAMVGIAVLWLVSAWSWDEGFNAGQVFGRTGNDTR